MAQGVAGVLAGLVVAAQGARVSISRSQGTNEADKTIAGVPVLNYASAYGGEARVSSDEKEHWLVFAKDGVETTDLEQLCESSDACEAIGHPSEGGVPFFEVFTTEEGLEKVLSQAPPGQLEFIEAAEIISLDPEPVEEEDPEGEVEAQSTNWGLATVGLSSATHTGSGVHIYVLDTGVRHSHSEFGGRASASLDLTSGSLVTCSGSSSTCSRDRNGHGTHCAGNAGGRNFGVATRARIYGVKVLGDDGRGSNSWSAQSLDWIATRGRSPRIASMSLGSSGISSTHRRAVDSATSAGVVVVVAAGNSNSDACNFSPAHVETAITVGSTTSSNARSSFSNFGRCVNIWAPGSSILSAGHNSDSDTRRMSGTSMACPHVSGAVALLFQAHGSSSSPDRMRRRLQDNSRRDRISGLTSRDVNMLLWVGR